MKLSPHFTLAEFTTSQIAARLAINNDPPINLLPALKNTSAGLELVRNLLGDRPIIVSSAYRSPALNDAVHGQRNSQHLLGEAVDFTCPSFGNPDSIVRAILGSNIAFDQCIKEFDRWVHISFSDRNRLQALIIDTEGTRVFA